MFTEVSRGSLGPRIAPHALAVSMVRRREGLVHKGVPNPAPRSDQNGQGKFDPATSPT
jgi:hypothetical protein